MKRLYERFDVSGDRAVRHEARGRLPILLPGCRLENTMATQWLEDPDCEFETSAGWLSRRRS